MLEKQRARVLPQRREKALHERLGVEGDRNRAPRAEVVLIEIRRAGVVRVVYREVEDGDDLLERTSPGRFLDESQPFVARLSAGRGVEAAPSVKQRMPAIDAHFGTRGADDEGLPGFAPRDDRLPDAGMSGDAMLHLVEPRDARGAVDGIGVHHPVHQGDGKKRRARGLRENQEVGAHSQN